MKRNLALTLLVVSLCPALALAEGGYFGSTFTYATYEEPGLELNPMTLGIRGGKDFNDNFAIEGRVGFGIADDDFDIIVGNQVFTLDAGINHYFSVYGKGTIPVNEQFGVYGLLGYSHGKIEVSAPGIASVSDTDSGLSYGIGAEFSFTPTTRLSVEWLRLIDGSANGVSYEIDGVGVNLDWGFGG